MTANVPVRNGNEDILVAFIDIGIIGIMNNNRAAEAVRILS